MSRGVSDGNGLPLEFSQGTLFEPFFEKPTFYYKKMFGGLAIYLNGKMIACLMEDPKQNYYKNKKFNYPIWYGILIPTFKEHQESLMKELPGTLPHPVLGKWLYLPWKSPQYDSTGEIFIQMLRRQDPRLGIIPNIRERKKTKKIKRKKKK